jgi:hypothetical protein
MWTSRPVLPLSTATARSTGAAATCGPALPPERRPLVPSHLSRLHDPVASEFRRTESSSPDLRSQRVGGDPKLRGGFPEGQKSHSAASCGLVSIGLTATLAGTFRKHQTRDLIEPREQGSPDRSDRMFGLAGAQVRGACGVRAPDSGQRGDPMPALRR